VVGEEPAQAAEATAVEAEVAEVEATEEVGAVVVGV
jgi:hypothetical protein